MSETIDHSVYPDLDEPPKAFHSLSEKADYLHRICGAWDFGLVPGPGVFRLLRDWREVFEQFPLPHSPAYHAFRAWFGWPPRPGSCLAADYERFDAAEGRIDPCVDMI